jgi:transposase InsO family protein
MTDLAARTFILAMVDEARLAGARQRLACETIGMQVRTLQRWRSEPTVGDRRPQRVQQPANKLDELERQGILAVANSAEFGHLPPSQIVPRLADQGTYLASESTFYRVLTAANQVKHRNAARRTAESSKPRAVQATGPNQLYSWDITYLPTTVRGVYFYLYMFMDIYSRKIVGWQVYDEEKAVLAAEVVRDICTREKIRSGQVVLHSDNGSPMKGATMLATLQRLGVVPSFSRPSVSNDNPYSESLFKTLKYRPGYPEKTFSELVDARKWVTQFADWYNNEHRHSAIRFLTPAQRHAGKDDELLRRREAVYEAAKALYPGRWSGETRNWQPVRVVHLNPAKSANYDSHRRAA